MDFPKKEIPHQERLEFLWDAILGAVIADVLYKNHREEKESWLTLAKISLVREEYLADVARRIWLWKYIYVWVWEERSQGRDKNSILSDSLESLIAAIYIIWWRIAVYKFIKDYIYISPEKLLTPTKSRKNQLQEICQKTFKVLPEYIDTILSAEENGNILLFWSVVYIWWKKYWEWSWVSKKKAQDQAAELSLILLKTQINMSS